MTAQSDCPQIIDQLENIILEALSSINVLFTSVDETEGLEFIDIYRRNFIKDYYYTLDAALEDLRELRTVPDSAVRYFRIVDNFADSIDSINKLAVSCGTEPLIKNLENCVFDALTAQGVFGESAEQELQVTSETEFLLCHGERICTTSSVLEKFLDLLRKESPETKALSRVRPEIAKLFKGKSDIKLSRGKISEPTMKLLSEKAREADPFCGSNAFRYIDNDFFPAELTSIRPTEKFFGYTGVRKIFKEHFNSFSLGKSNLPLLVSSLPGLGKTHFTISYTLSHDNLTLILPEPDDLEKTLEPLIRKLSIRKDHKFLLFFDDVDPAKINWYYFRTNVGGSFTLPDNISIAIASNFEFPANILSRGRAVKFPMFDEIRCMEMIEEFLKYCGMKHCPGDLINVIAADYTEEFGQRKFEELSPRTLIRYLEVYEKDMKKRKKMLDMSRAEMITKPDPQMFYEFNIKLMKALYGPEIVDAMREEALKKEISNI
jgi:predicted AAA+ superfamily ATPase